MNLADVRIALARLGSKKAFSEHGAQRPVKSYFVLTAIFA
jgi:hypothetical protein